MGGLWHRSGRGHQGPVRRSLLLRLRGRRSADVDGLQHQGQPVRCRAEGHDGIRHRPLGRPRHDRGAGGGVGDGRSRLDRRGAPSRSSPSPTRCGSTPAPIRRSSRERWWRRPSTSCLPGGLTCSISLLRGGTVVDGTGAPATWPTSACATGRIVAVGRVDETGQPDHRRRPAGSCAPGSSTCTPTTTPSCCGTPRPVRRCFTG